MKPETSLSTGKTVARHNDHANVQAGGTRPPCLDKTPGQCRGCYGWDQMLEAAQKGGPWRKAVIRCDCTGLTIRLSGEKTGRK